MIDIKGLDINEYQIYNHKKGRIKKKKKIMKRSVVLALSVVLLSLLVGCGETVAERTILALQNEIANLKRQLALKV